MFVRTSISLLVGLPILLAASTTPAAAQSLRLNEIQADNEVTLADEFDEHDDWFELINLGASPVDLQGLYFSDDPDLVDLHRIPAPLVVPSGGRTILWADGQPQQGTAHLPFRLSSSGEDLYLLASDGVTVLDHVDFPRQFTDHVYQRLPEGTGVWSWGRDPTPGLANTEAHYEGFLSLNELMSLNAATAEDEAGDHDPWLEIANPLPIPISLAGSVLRVVGGGEVTLSGPSVPASGYGLLWLDDEPGEGANHLPAFLSTGGGALVLEATDGVSTDSVIYPPLAADQAYARIPDGGVWQATDLATPGQTNPATLDPLLVINEFVASNATGALDETGAAEDWVELYNPGDATVQLNGLSLTDDLTQPGKWPLPTGSLAPGAFLLIWCDDDPGDGPFHATFKLSAGGEEIGLHLGETLVDGLVFGPQTVDVSTGRRVDAGLPWIAFTSPTPAASNGTGVGVPGTTIPAPRLEAPHPNPFNPRTRIVFHLSETGAARLDVFDLRGRHVRNLVRGDLPAGRHAVIWHGDDAARRPLPSGTYGVRLSCGEQECKRYVTLVR